MLEKIQYREDTVTSRRYKENYLSGIEKVIQKREQDACLKRDIYSKDIFCNQETYREDLKQMLGWPLNEKGVRTVPDATFEQVADEEKCTIYRVTIKVLEGLELTGLFFKKVGTKPLVVVQHGKEGTPELISNLYGDTCNYNEIVERVLQEEVHVFAPQLLLWSNETYQVEYDRIALDARLKRVGSSITALEVYGIMRILDYFEAQDYVSTFGMVGLSYGGFYTLYATAIDTRIQSAVSCSFFNKRSEIAWPDWTWYHSAELFDDAEIACLIYPRKLCIEVGKQDAGFPVQYAVETFEKLKNMCEKVGLDWVKFIAFDGTHEFCKDDEPIKKLVREIRRK